MADESPFAVHSQGYYRSDLKAESAALKRIWELVSKNKQKRIRPPSFLVDPIPLKYIRLKFFKQWNKADNGLDFADDKANLGYIIEFKFER